MPNFKVLSHFRLRKWLSKIKKRVLTPSFSHLTFSSQMGTLSSVRHTQMTLFRPTGWKQQNYHTPSAAVIGGTALTLLTVPQCLTPELTMCYTWYSMEGEEAILRIHGIALRRSDIFCTIASVGNVCRFEEGPLLLSTTTKTRLRENGRMVRSLGCRIRIGSRSNFLL